MAITKRIKPPTKWKPVDLITYYQIVTNKEVTETDKSILSRVITDYSGDNIYDLLYFLRTVADNQGTLYPLMVGDKIPKSYLNKYRYYARVNSEIKLLMSKLEDILVSWVIPGNVNGILAEMDEIIAKL